MTFETSKFILLYTKSDTGAEVRNAKSTESSHERPVELVLLHLQS